MRPTARLSLAGLDAAPVDVDHLGVVGEQRLPVTLQVAREQAAGETGHHLRRGNGHAVDAAARDAEAQGRADAEEMDVAKPRRLARSLLQELIVRAEVGIVCE